MELTSEVTCAYYKRLRHDFHSGLFGPERCQVSPAVVPCRRTTYLARMLPMAQASEEELRAAWQRLARRNRWTLVDDVEAFLLEAEAARTELGDSRLTEAQAEVAVLRTYGRHFYLLLVARNERAADELWRHFYSMALGKKWSQQDAEDIAMEATFRVLEKLHQLRSPESIFRWTGQVFRTAQQLLIRQRRDEMPMPTDSEGEQLDVPDPRSLAETAEYRALAQEFFDILHASPLDELDRAIIFRSYVFEEKPGEIGASYGLESPYIRNRKCRAVRELRGIPRFVQLLREIASSFSGADGAVGGEQYES
jgi:DNA-directed RNA polymerase specialized sigma24 family protein